MAQVVVYLQSSGDWDAVEAWNTAANGSGSAVTDPQNDSDTYICDLNGNDANLNVAISVDQIRTGQTTAGGTIAVPNSTASTITLATADVGLYSNYAGLMLTWGTGTCSLTVNGDVTYAGTSTSGMFAPAANQTLTINGKVSCSGIGRVIRLIGGTLVVSNGTSTALENTSTGRCLDLSSGSFSITGNVSCTGGGYGISGGGASTGSLNGNLSMSLGKSVEMNGGTLNWTPGSGLSIDMSGGSPVQVTGTLNILGPLTTRCTVSNSWAIHCYSGTMNYLGSYAMPASSEAIILVRSGTLNLATAGSRLQLANSGAFVIYQNGGTLNMADIGAGATEIVNQTATSYAAIIGGTDAQKACITGPTLPDVANVWYGSGQYGYAGGLLTPTKRASSIANCEAGNVKKDVVIDDVTGSYEGEGGSTVIVIDD